MSLACEDANSKLVLVVTVADVGVDDSLVQISKLKFGHTLKGCAPRPAPALGKIAAPCIPDALYYS